MYGVCTDGQHPTQDVMLLAAFPNRLISRFVYISWPPSSPDLTPLDFFLQEYLKERVYTTLQDPKVQTQLSKVLSTNLRSRVMQAVV